MRAFETVPLMRGAERGLALADLYPRRLRRTSNVFFQKKIWGKNPEKICEASTGVT